MGNAVIAVSISRGLDTRPLSHRGYRNPRVGYSGAGRIGNRAEDASVNRLAGGWGRPEADDERKYCQGGQND